MSNRNTDDNWTIGNYYKNRYREVVDLDEEDYYYEVEIYGQGEYHIGQIDKEFIDKFTERTWNAFKNGNNLYMYSNKIKKFSDRPQFHQLVFPDVDIVDHINGNGLDNRKKNLKDGSGGVNNNNKAQYNNNTSGTNGVSFHKRDKSWVARWQENGISQYKSFSIKDYGIDEKAKQKAIEYRKAMNEITGCLNGERKSIQDPIEIL